MSKRRLSCESYSHKFAKAVVTEWIRHAAANADDAGVAVAMDDIPWHVSRDAPTWGVFNEYPILPCATGVDPTWPAIDRRWREAPPSARELTRMLTWPAAIIDVAIEDRGMISYCLEITHGNPLSDEKVDFLWNVGIHRIIELPAQWVLAQIEPPKYLPGEFWRLGKPMMIPLWERPSASQVSAGLRTITASLSAQAASL